MNSGKSKVNALDLGKEYGYLAYMVKRFVDILGEEETIKLLYFNEKELPKTIRLNSLRAPYQKIVESLERKGIKLKEVPHLSECKEVLETKFALGATAEYLNGFYMIQGKNSLFPSKVLKPKKGEIIGDFAAAPGGKTSHIAQLMENSGTIVAIDISTNRCRSLKSNLARMGVENTIAINMDTRDVSSLNLSFDKILLDAPCSGSGIITSDPSRKNSKSMDDIIKYYDYQVSLLTESLNVLKPGGVLVYSTCSLEPEENELVISTLLESEKIRIVNIDIKGEPGLLQFENYHFHPDLNKAKRLYPHKTQGEGFFIARLVKIK
ncbi:MAG: RsmB/NOP family class I SAM-dependent RNA methyltransferase [Candidatus Heimdallarchaeaceae archaeon]|jgi:NOL1/NOP2/sun family putative RNA methylase